MAKTHDPSGDRTLGVVTKIDMCQTDGIRRTLEATAPGCVQLRLGFIAVIAVPSRKCVFDMHVSRHSQVLETLLDDIVSTC